MIYRWLGWRGKECVCCIGIGRWCPGGPFRHHCQCEQISICLQRHTLNMCPSVCRSFLFRACKPIYSAHRTHCSCRLVNWKTCKKKGAMEEPHYCRSEQRKKAPIYFFFNLLKEANNFSHENLQYLPKVDMSIIASIKKDCQTLHESTNFHFIYILWESEWGSK